MSDLLAGLLAPYRAGAAATPTGISESPLLSLAIQSVMANQAPSFSGGGSGSGTSTGGQGSGPAPTSGSIADWIRQAEQATGVGSDWTKGLQILIQHESGGDPTIVNQTPTPLGRHARGLAQMIPPTFDAYNIPGLGGIFNPVANLAAAIRYMQDRYGGLSPGVKSVLAGGSYSPY